MDMAKAVCGVEQKRKLENNSLSNVTIRCCKSNMFQDVFKQVAEIRASKARISLQLDESSNVSNCVYLLVYCRYVYAGEFLMCKRLETTTKAANVREKMDNFFQQNNVS